jgi:hypothetical protein
MTQHVETPRIANATTAEKEHCRIAISDDMIRAAAAVLFNEPLLAISEGWAEDLATEMLERALSQYHETGRGEPQAW